MGRCSLALYPSDPCINILQPWTLTILCCKSINTCSLKATHFQHINHCKWNIPSEGQKKQGWWAVQCEPSTRCGCGWLVTPSINNIDSSLQNSGSSHLARGHLPSAALFRVKWSLQRCRGVKVDNDTGPLVSMFQWFQWFTLHHSDIITTEDTAAMVHRFYVLCPHLINLVKCCWVNSGIIY